MSAAAPPPLPAVPPAPARGRSRRAEHDRVFGPGFRGWLRRHVILGLALTLGLVGFFVVRRALAVQNPLAGFDAGRVWVTGWPASGGWGTPDAVATTPGGAPLAVDAHISQHFISWNQANNPPGVAWDVVHLSVRTGRRLVGTSPENVGAFALLGETREVGGVLWKEAWRFPLAGGGPVFVRHDLRQAGVWEIAWGGGTPARLRLETDRTTIDVTDAGAHWMDGTWSATDGVLYITLTRDIDAGVAGAQPTWMLVRVSDDGATFSGFDSLNAPVSGRRIE